MDLFSFGTIFNSSFPPHSCLMSCIQFFLFFLWFWAGENTDVSFIFISKNSIFLLLFCGWVCLCECMKFNDLYSFFSSRFYAHRFSCCLLHRWKLVGTVGGPINHMIDVCIQKSWTNFVRTIIVSIFDWNKFFGNYFLFVGVCWCSFKHVVQVHHLFYEKFVFDGKSNNKFESTTLKSVSYRWFNVQCSLFSQQSVSHVKSIRKQYRLHLNKKFSQFWKTIRMCLPREQWKENRTNLLPPR